MEGLMLTRCALDITKVVTPDLKEAESSVLVHVDMSPTRARLGGSALAQVSTRLFLPISHSSLIILYASC